MLPKITLAIGVISFTIFLLQINNLTQPNETQHDCSTKCMVATYSEIIQLKKPNLSIIQARIIGNTFENYLETEDASAILKNPVDEDDKYLITGNDATLLLMNIVFQNLNVRSP